MDTFTASASATYFYMTDVLAAVDTTRSLPADACSLTASTSGVCFIYRAPKPKTSRR